MERKEGPVQHKKRKHLFVILRELLGGIESLHPATKKGALR